MITHRRRAGRASQEARRLPAVPVMLAAVVLVLAGCADSAAGAADARVLEAGRDQYIQSCSRCHQHDGSGFANLYPTLAGNPLVTLHSPRPVIDIVMNGRGSMPAFRYALEAEEVASVITYIRNSWGNEAPPVSPGQVR